MKTPPKISPDTETAFQTTVLSFQLLLKMIMYNQFCVFKASFGNKHWSKVQVSLQMCTELLGIVNTKSIQSSSNRIRATGKPGEFHGRKTYM